MCMRRELNYYEGAHNLDALSPGALQASNGQALLVGGGGAQLERAEALVWAPPVYPLVGDGLLLASRSLAASHACFPPAACPPLSRCAAASRATPAM